ncbi:OmpA family protein [Vaginella massiliensis]|uniref:OmpA family protein n=1 Tax=Vaginella massiliensis TaxID=1816680 RepID=UPI00083977FF|nr:OmpA family protein [Vaginella massiliensis]
MKKFNLLLSTVMLFVAGSTFVDAQNSQNPWAITVGAHATDHKAVRGAFNHYFDTDNWSIVPPLSKLSVIRNVNRSFDVDLTASVGEIDNKRLKIDDELFINAGLGLRYKFANGYILNENSWFDPYLRVGASYHRYDYTSLGDKPWVAYQGQSDKEYVDLLNNPDAEAEKNHFALQGGAGINFWFTKNFGLNVASDYNWIPSTGADYFDFFQHTVGVTFRFGNRDRDGDGIPDDEDACPDDFGIKTDDPATNGCPDRDGDGIPDHLDACPDVPGVAEYNGCPDTDGDGIPDNLDECPTVAGPAENNGCPWPDTDGDGIPDKDDACPTEPGLPQFQGCPDTDGDGIPDKDDECPTEKGPAENNGCPWKIEHVTRALSAILFEYNSDKIIPESERDVIKAANILKSEDFRDKDFYVDGHTDQRGTAAYNKKLSDRRAKAIVNALKAQGVNADRLTPRGLGESNLLCKEENETCWQQNRRVELLPKEVTTTTTIKKK